MKAASDLTQERLTVVEISGGDGSSYRHRRELKVTQSIGSIRPGLGDTGANRFGLNFQCFRSDRFKRLDRVDSSSSGLIPEPRLLRWEEGYFSTMLPHGLSRSCG
jgi:hypothetical protein